LKEKLNLRFVLRIISYFTTIVISGWLLESSALPWIVELVMFGLIAAFSAFLFGLLQWRSFVEVIRKREEIPSGEL
jgi:VIT1/CCC1 family predicted Fe2+/Mn2+ transporter